MKRPSMRFEQDLWTRRNTIFKGGKCKLLQKEEKQEEGYIKKSGLRLSHDKLKPCF